MNKTINEMRYYTILIKINTNMSLINFFTNKIKEIIFLRWETSYMMDSR